MLLIRITIIAMLLSGCISRYSPPLEGEIAAIRYVSEGIDVDFFTTENPDCTGSIYPIAILNERGKMSRKLPMGRRVGVPVLDSKGLLRSQFTETTIRADKPFVVWARMAENLAMCNVALVFNPEAGAWYETKSVGRSGYCRLMIWRIIEKDGQYVKVPEETAERVKGHCWF